MKVKLNQENVFGEVPIYNRLYQGIEGLSKAAISGFSLLKKTVSKISENVKEMIRDNLRRRGELGSTRKSNEDSSSISKLFLKLRPFFSLMQYLLMFQPNKRFHSCT